MYYINLSILNLLMKIIPCIVGLGYVGLPIAQALSKNFFTYGFDINNERINHLKKKIDINNEFNKEEFKKIKKISTQIKLIVCHLLHHFEW